MSWFDDLRDRLETEGQRPHALSSGAGRFLVVEHGARLLACDLPGVARNPLFVMDDKDGHATGGDRLWIAPEVAYYWPSLEQAREDPIKWAATPTQIDPGEYSNTGPWPGGVHLENRMSLQDARDGRRIDLHARRALAALPPLDTLPDGVTACALSITHTLVAAGGDTDAVAGAWSIMQVPPPGTLICPTTTRVQPRSYYDPFGDRHVLADDHAIRFRIDGQRRIKMGVLPEHTTGRMAYYQRREGGGASTLIVRVFPTLPGETYIDIPRDHPADQRRGGDCLQAYNDDGTYGGFGEMEHHDPAVIVGGRASRTATSVTHLLAGPDEAIRRLGRDLLGVAVTAPD